MKETAISSNSYLQHFHSHHCKQCSAVDRTIYHYWWGKYRFSIMEFPSSVANDSEVLIGGLIENFVHNYFPFRTAFDLLLNVLLNRHTLNSTTFTTPDGISHKQSAIPIAKYGAEHPTLPNSMQCMLTRTVTSCGPLLSDQTSP